MKEKTPSKSELYQSVIHFMTNLLNVTKRDLSFMEDTIRKNKGHIRIIMHPFSLSDHPESDEFLHKYLANVLAQHSTDYTFHGKSTITPTFLFLEEYNFKKIKETLEKMLGIDLVKLGIILIPTLLDRGQPIKLFAEEGEKLYNKYYSDRDEYRFENLNDKRRQEMLAYEALVNILTYLNVKSATISGGYIGAFPLVDAQFGRCLGILTEVLKQSQFKIDFSKWVLYKDDLSREYLKEVSYPLKQTGKKT